MQRPDNEMLIAILEISKETDNATYFKSARFGLNSITANLKNGKLYLSIQYWPKKDQAPSVTPNDPNTFRSTEEDVPF